MFGKVRADFVTDLTEFNGEGDHGPLLVRYPPHMQVPRPVDSFKGVPSRRLRQQLRMGTHRNHLWSPSYFAASCGGAPLSLIRRYVENQCKPNQRPVPRA